MFSVSDKEEKRDNGGYLLYEKLLSFDAAQKMHHNWIMDYGTQQVSGVSVVASVQAELDFGLLKKMYSDGNRAFRLYQSPFYKAG